MFLPSTSTKHLPHALAFAVALLIAGCSMEVEYLRAGGSTSDARRDSSSSDAQPTDRTSADVPIDGEAGVPPDSSLDADGSRELDAAAEADAGRPIKKICDDAAPPCSSPAMIADMENDDGRSCDSQGRSGQWVASGDGTSTNFAPPFGPLTTFEPLPACRDMSAVALHVVGGGFVGTGANVMAAFTSAGVFYNATGYLGVRFWAKTSRDYTLRIDVSTRGTTDAQDGGLCNPAPSRPCVPYGVRKPLVAAMDWQLVTVQWNELKGLDANGVPPPSPLDPTSVKYVRFDFEPVNVSFDVWIDDLTFF